jgi:hypothetical protein
MKPRKPALLALVAAATLTALPLPAGAADSPDSPNLLRSRTSASSPAPTLGSDHDPLACVPDDASVILGLNTRAFFESEIFQNHLSDGFLEDVAGPLPILGALMEMDVRDQLDSIVLFSNDLSELDGAAIIQGNFNKTRLLEILRSETDSSQTTLSATENTIIIADSKALLDSCLYAREHPEASFSLANRRQSYIPRADKVVAWAAVTQTSQDFRETTRIASMAVTVELQAEFVILRGRVQIDQAEDIENWLVAARLALEAAQLQTVSPEAARIARMIRMDRTRGSNSVEIELDLTFDELRKLWGETHSIVTETFGMGQ